MAMLWACPEPVDWLAEVSLEDAVGLTVIVKT